MKIFIINYWYNKIFKRKKGGPIKVLELADNLRGMGHEAILFLPKLGFPEKQTQATVKQIPVVDISGIRPICYSLFNLYRLFISVKKLKPDIIYIRYMLDFIPAVFARLLRIPCIIEVNDEIHSSHTTKGRILNLFNLINFWCADKIIVLTEGLKSKLVNLNAVTAEKIVVGSSGTNTTIFYPRRKADCRKIIGMDESRKVIGFAGTFMYNYGIDVLIDASPQIIKYFPEARFLIVGRGEAETCWKEKVKQENMAPYFVFPGQVSREDAAIYIGAMDVCVAPYHLSRGETSPVKLFDYFACARPVIASLINAMAAVENEFPGLVLVNPEDPNALARAIVNVFENQNSYENAAMKSKEIVFEKYSWRNIAEQVVEVSRSIIY